MDNGEKLMLNLKEKGGREEERQGYRNSFKILPSQGEILMVFYACHLLTEVLGLMLLGFELLVPIYAFVSQG